MIARLQARFTDWRRERRIKRLVARMVGYTGRSYSTEQRDTWDALKAECAARSPEQVARMERRQGLA